MVIVYGLSLKDGTQLKKPIEIVRFNDCKKALDDVRSSSKMVKNVGLVFNSKSPYFKYKTVCIAPLTTW